MKIITSAENVEIKSIASLATSKGRKEQNRFVAEGVRTIKTLLSSNIELVKIYCLQEMASELEEKLGREIKESKICLITSNILNKISLTSTPSGIVAVFEIPVQLGLERLSRGIILAQIQDPGNMGTLIRVAAAMGVSSVVCIEGCDQWSPKVVQASAGTIGLVDIFDISWQTLVQNKKDLSLCAMIVTGGKEIEEVNFKNTLLVVGNEANGIPREWLNDCQDAITLKMPGKTESLNAAIAGSIAMYIAFAK